MRDIQIAKMNKEVDEELNLNRSFKGNFISKFIYVGVN